MSGENSEGIIPLDRGSSLFLERSCPSCGKMVPYNEYSCQNCGYIYLTIEGGMALTSFIDDTLTDIRKIRNIFPTIEPILEDKVDLKPFENKIEAISDTVESIKEDQKKLEEQNRAALEDFTVVRQKIEEYEELKSDPQIQTALDVINNVISLDMSSVPQLMVIKQLTIKSKM